MDPLDDFLITLRARGALFVQSRSNPPWALWFTEPAPLSLATMLSGTGCVVREGEVISLGPGDVVLLRGPTPYRLGDRPGTEPQIIIDGQDRCYAIDDDPATAGDNFRLAPRTYGTAGSSELLLTASWGLRGHAAQWLLRALPPVLTVRLGRGNSALSLLAAEAGRDDPGQQTVLDRLLDLLVIDVLRDWFNRPEVASPPGYRALADPHIGPVLRELHERPADPWTVASLAAVAGMSRSTFARRFTALVGRPPLAYLTDWRMTLAADLLAEPRRTIGAVANLVGYSDAFAFSAAFKRIRGVAPSASR